MGIQFRIENLFKLNYDMDQLKELESQYHRLVDPEEMGKIYKFMMIGKGELTRIGLSILLINNCMYKVSPAV